MGKYERRTRQGWTLYHENLYMLEALPPEDVKALIVALTRYSVALANDDPPPDFSDVTNPIVHAICLMFASRIEKDSDAYKSRCENSAINRNKKNATTIDRGQPESTKVNGGRTTELNGAELNGAEQNGAEPSRVEAERNFCGGGFDLNHEAERRARSKHDNASALDIQRELRDLQRAGELARTYGLPQTLAVYDSILEDVKRCDWEQVESAIKEASASNSRGCVSVNFYRVILKNRRIPRSHLKDL